MNALIKTDDILSSTLERIESSPKLSETSKAQYKKALLKAVEAGVNLADAESLRKYSLTLKQSSRGFLKAAISMWAKEMQFQSSNNINDGNIVEVIKTDHRLFAITHAIETTKEKGQKQHTWLSLKEMDKVFSLCDTSTLIGQRDKVLFILLFHCGLRRDEAVNAKFSDLIECPVEGEIRLCLNIKGKADKLRTLPLSSAPAQFLKDWQDFLKSDGKILRSVSKGELLGDDMSSVAIFQITQKYGEMIAKPKLAPHDCRRSFAENGYRNGIDLTQISVLMGHESLETTRRYLNVKLDLTKTVSDVLPFN